MSRRPLHERSCPGCAALNRRVIRAETTVETLRASLHAQSVFSAGLNVTVTRLGNQNLRLEQENVRLLDKMIEYEGVNSMLSDRVVELEDRLSHVVNEHKGQLETLQEQMAFLMARATTPAEGNANNV